MFLAYLIKCDRPIMQLTKQRSPIPQNQNKAIARLFKLILGE
ncbi:hypothetical protein [Pseudanabaena sp. ABRG5-3]|nr:hypothetical protein [Pseudanabaena sp. ABRG5-3]